MEMMMSEVYIFTPFELLLPIFVDRIQMSGLCYQITSNIDKPPDKKVNRLNSQKLLPETLMEL